MNSDTKFYVILFVLWTALTVGVTWYILDIRNDRNNQLKIKQIELGVKKIDSVKTIRNHKLDSVKSESNYSVKKSTELLKKINHEKIIVPDTTYISMCKYVENYRPK